MRRTLAIAAGLAGALLTAAPALASDPGFAPIRGESPNAEGINDIYWLIFAITGLVFLLVQGALVYFVVRYRRGRRPVEAEGPQVHGHTRLELLWTAIPVLLLAVIVGYVLYKVPGLENPPAAEAERVSVTVEGRQFYWRFVYPDGTVGYDTMVVPVDRVVELQITAPEHDVIHSWWVPALGGKRDSTPGRTVRMWFRAGREGEYVGRCTEFCGLQHSAMLGAVRVVAAARWQPELDRLRGRRLGENAWDAACAKCHRLDQPVLIGPSLRGNPILGDRETLEQLIRNGQGAMPAVARGWTDAEVDALFEYVQEYASDGD